jgi:hypothetical protein
VEAEASESPSESQSESQQPTGNRLRVRRKSLEHDESSLRQLQQLLPAVVAAPDPDPGQLMPEQAESEASEAQLKHGVAVQAESDAAHLEQSLDEGHGTTSSPQPRQLQPSESQSQTTPSQNSRGCLGESRRPSRSHCPRRSPRRSPSLCTSLCTSLPQRPPQRPPHHSPSPRLLRHTYHRAPLLRRR